MKHPFRVYLHWTSPSCNILLVSVGLIALSLLLFSTFLNDNMSYSQSAKKPSAHGVDISTPKQDDKISFNIDNFTIDGRSLDTSKSDCQVLVIVNDLKPYQSAVANGPNGDDDFSQWFFTLSPETKLKMGTNKITAKIDCKKPLDALMYDTVRITGTNAHFPDEDREVNNAEKASAQPNGTLQVDRLSVNNTSKKLDTNVVGNSNNSLSNDNLSSTQFKTSSGQQEQTLTDAADIYSKMKMTVPPGVKYLVVLIPNEGHESVNQPKNQLPLTNQPYLPQNAVIDKDTSVIWLNADVGHRHKISINEGNSKIFESEFFNYNKASAPVRFNKTGTYQYWESAVSKEVPDFVMRGTITVTSENQNMSESQNKLETVGTFMVPAMFLDKYRSEFMKAGFIVGTDFTYKDLRGGQRGTGPEQTLITWSTSETNIDKVISELEKITSTLPYS